MSFGQWTVDLARLHMVGLPGVTQAVAVAT